MGISQMSFELPEINRKETRNKVEAALEKYQMFKLMEPIEAPINITASYSDTPTSGTGATHSKTESAALNKISQEEERKSYIRKIDTALKRLNRKESAIIKKRYIEDDDNTDYLVYNELGFSETTYYRIKADAFYKLAFILKIAVYKEESES
ncbi:ArpU family phage packaging/lysis transcriptional regulator [Pontibacillus salipaludis]|uniref:ArpU family transcriptional regulator n=1 Tax=Pontibacillus salipaludis TaxID=1697394 RepID=A0ABQ1PWM8_9BACI|nr:ArpU family phage packaging/lysis transcriptional regulator [Pontibacillus salipaludis]GGD05304.1 ArpU family transcriptional regulator [Pontibacillus salipaludis]